MIRSIGTIVILAVCSVTAAADRETFTARVVSIHDGDCVTVLRADNRQSKLRLAEIDAPELKQPFGSKARDHLAALVMGKQIAVENHGPDRYGRTLAHVVVEGQDVLANTYCLAEPRAAVSDPSRERF